MARLNDYWDVLPKWARVIPYVVLSGALTALIRHLSEVEVADTLLMAAINIAIVSLRGAVGYLKK